jgi:hypothetical protein
MWHSRPRLCFYSPRTRVGFVSQSRSAVNGGQRWSMAVNHRQRPHTPGPHVRPPRDPHAQLAPPPGAGGKPRSADRTFSDMFRTWPSLDDDPIRSNHSAKAPPGACRAPQCFSIVPVSHGVDPADRPPLVRPPQPKPPLSFIPSHPQHFRQIPRKSGRVGRSAILLQPGPNS